MTWKKIFIAIKPSIIVNRSETLGGESVIFPFTTSPFQAYNLHIHEAGVDQILCSLVYLSPPTKLDSHTALVIRTGRPGFNFR
jgi:hypothetical protein